MPVTLQADEVGMNDDECDAGEEAAREGMAAALRAAAAACAAPGAAEEEWWAASTAGGGGRSASWDSRGTRALISSDDAAVCASPRRLLSPPAPDEECSAASHGACAEAASAIERMSEVATAAANALYSACTWPPPRSRLHPRGLPSQNVRRDLGGQPSAAAAATGASGSGDGAAAVAAAGSALYAAAAAATAAAAGGREAGRALASEMQDVKKYGAGFAWGQLAGWFKQTVLDPTASLSADRRGTLSLPDVRTPTPSLHPTTC